MASQKGLEAQIAKLIDSEIGLAETFAYEDFIDLLHRLQLVRPTATSKEVALAQQVWEALPRKETQSATKQEVRKLLFVLMGGRSAEPDSKALAKKFTALRHNRLSASRSRVHSRCQEKEFTFSPRVNAVSAGMAMSARKKVAESCANLSGMASDESLLSNSRSLPDLLLGAKFIRER